MRYGIVRKLCLLASIVCVVAACGSGERTAQPTATAAAGGTTGGLGLALADWERAHGAGAPTNDPAFISYEGGRYIVSAQADGTIVRLEVLIGDESATILLEEARVLARSLIPADAVVFATYELSSDGRVVDQCFSESLKVRFPETNRDNEATPDAGSAGTPGDCVITYDDGVSNRVGRIVIHIGSAP